MYIYNTEREREREREREILSPCALHVDFVGQGELRGPEFVETSPKPKGGDGAGERGSPRPPTHRRRHVNQSVDGVGVNTGRFLGDRVS